MPVREIMSTEVIGIDPDDTAEVAAKRMKHYDVGNLVVMRNKKAIGIVTEEDLVRKLVSKNLLPEKVKIGDIMTSPLITVSPKMSLTLAMKIMLKNNIRRLPIIEDKKLVGIITNKDLLSVSPELNRILIDLIEINRDLEIKVPEEKSENPVFQGKCDRCGAFSENLREVEGMLLCEGCYEEMMA
ncbi:MAG: Inosine-5'-monophosphate dehydrogenase [Candidatus Methanolliviera sp. GoM_asphalt]|nr:MAG: Inosine-5'-monophosphate dehydrogenase [Candidatus Methanolliviera sp. GoM_asphalt]